MKDAAAQLERHAWILEDMADRLDRILAPEKKKPPTGRGFLNGNLSSGSDKCYRRNLMNKQRWNKV